MKVTQLTTWRNAQTDARTSPGTLYCTHVKRIKDGHVLPFWLLHSSFSIMALTLLDIAHATASKLSAFNFLKDRHLLATDPTCPKCQTPMRLHTACLACRIYLDLPRSRLSSKAVRAAWKHVSKLQALSPSNRFPDLRLGPRHSSRYCCVNFSYRKILARCHRRRKILPRSSCTAKILPRSSCTAPKIVFEIWTKDFKD